MIASKILSASSQRIRTSVMVRRIAGLSVVQGTIDLLLGHLGTRAVLRATLASQQASESSAIDVVLVSSNGAGLGHLTRLEAISRRLRGSSVIYTLSKGYHKLGKRAEELVYFPSSRTLDLNSRTWNTLLFNHFGAFIASSNPKVIVFDGTYLYSGIVDVSKTLDIPLVWIRRGRWRSEIKEQSAQYNSPQDFCDLVIVPGEYAGTDESAQPCATLEVDPVLVHQHDELLSRAEAAEKLGLDSSFKYVLVQLGAGTINDIDGWVSAACSEIMSLGSDWKPVLLNNPLSERSNLPSGAEVIEAFPISLYLNLFDFVIVAAGYNSVQEAVASEIPCIVVPNFSTVTDDQEARAAAIHNAGLGLKVDSLESLGAAIGSLARPDNRKMMINRQRRQVRPLGALQISDILYERYLS